MKLGIGSYTYTWSIGAPGYPPASPLDALGLLEKAAELGVGVVQFADNLPLESLPAQELDALQARATALGIQVEVGTRGIQAGHLRQCLALAARFGSPILRVVIDSAQVHPTLEQAQAWLAPLRDDFLAAGVTLAIENHDRFKASDLAALVRALGCDWCGVCLDTVNSFGALEGPEVVLAALGPLTVNLHVKDFTIARAGHNMGFTIEGRPAGQGRLDVPLILSELRRYGRDPNAILELWTPLEADLPSTIAREQRWAQESVQYLQQVIVG